MITEPTKNGEKYMIKVFRSIRIIKVKENGYWVIFLALGLSKNSIILRSFLKELACSHTRDRRETRWRNLTVR
jgi:hypothetical protein